MSTRSIGNWVIAMNDDYSKWEGISPTEYQIIKAYVDLMEEKPYMKIKVKEIVERGGVSRSTFYAHYQDSLDVVEQIERYLLDNLQLYPANSRVVSQKSQFSSDSNPPSSDLPSSDPAFASLVNWFDTCLRFKHTLHALFGGNGDPYFKTRLSNSLRSSFQHMMDDDNAPDDKFRKFFVELQTASHIGLMEYVVGLSDDDELISSYEIA